jgi:hypothetical protein
MILNRPLTCVAVGMAAIGRVTTALAASDDGQPEAAITGTNPASGASWQMRIDYPKPSVDSNPARLSRTEISWRDAKDGRGYTLKRVSGELTVVGASSTGGYFVFDRCELRKSG